LTDEKPVQPRNASKDPSVSPEERHRLIEDLLARHATGGAGALQDLWREIYTEVHRLARSMLSREGARKPIETTVLVHELYLKMGGATFENRAHLFGSLARMMGQIVTDAARRANRERRAGEVLANEVLANGALANGARGLALDTPALGLPADGTGEMSARVIEALERLDRLAPRAAAVAWLRFVGGLTIEQVAICLDVSQRTVKTDWAFARAWMHREISASGRSAPDARET
jgi:RNA polymerase sigma factor (sigma-70 family)